MYALCKVMKWAHLPVAGGLYDQHPALIDAFEVILEEESKAEKRRQARQKQQSRSPSAGRRRR